MQNTTIFNHDLFLDMVFSHLPLYFLKIPRHLKWREKKYRGEGKIGENHNICGKIA